ncbi:MAG TPA: ABC transporter ATP-binding protein [Gemmatimonadales bacterium]|nr:ABC transporter ATP-binding protein [Gemmatimonadales bacterium]
MSTRAAAPAIQTEGLGRDYGAVRALDALDLRVEAGALVGLLGPNGAGKTTAMLLLATLLAPTRGSAKVFGHDVVRERTAVRRRLGLVFQETSVDGLLTVEENLRFAGRLAGLGGNALRQAVHETLERTGLAARAAQPAKQLSGGWRRLADIARATLHRPELLILDEPTVGLDPEHRDKMWRLLEAERRERGATILFSTHYLDEAEPSDRVVMLARGTVVADGSPTALRNALGHQVAEIDGRGADGLVEALRTRGLVQSAQRTERGWRVGLAGGREEAAALTAAAAELTRLVIRPPTLEDVYFARTQPGAAGGRR